MAAEPQRLEPIDALGASPLDMNVQADQDTAASGLSTPVTVEPSSPMFTMPTPSPSIAPSTNLTPPYPVMPSFMQDKGEPPEETGTEQPPTSPPPVPPPMMPPSMPSQ